MAPKPQNVIGQRFGRLVLIDELPRSSSSINRNRWFIAMCDCGATTECRLDSLRNNTTTSCGCYRLELAKELLPKFRRTSHGEAGRIGKSAEYVTWWGMIQRCEYPTFRGYEYYGGRGIKVCKRWRDSFEDFLSDMGRKPTEKHSIDRIDSNGNYEPGNCRWATSKEQAVNQRRSNQYAKRKQLKAL